MVRTTETSWKRFVAERTTSTAITVALLSVLVATPAALIGCSGSDPGAKGPSTEASRPVGASMAGPAQTVVISKQAVANKPQPWDLSNPEAAIRSYLDWTSYAYRITESAAATPTMSANEEVRVDSYVQYNLQKSRILDQSLQLIALGKPAVGATSTIIPAREKWTYRYVSISEVGKTIGGPYELSYETTYTLVKNGKGGWVVDSVAATALGEVK